MRRLRMWIFVLLILVAGILAWNNVWSNRGYSPVQPLPFSHKIMAGDNHIPCQYCHVNADRSAHATVPSLNVCMNCHSVVAVTKPDIVTLTKIWNSGKPIEWTRVHKLPEFVYFEHQPHIAHGFACQTCHGPVETMMQLYQWRRLNMGDCLLCHRDNGGPTDCFTCHR
jgi:hypothetical protein